MIDPESDIVTLSASEADAAVRLDLFVTAQVESLSRSRVQSLIRAGHVQIAGKPVVNPGHKLKPGDTVSVAVPPPEPAQPLAEHMALDVAFEDGHVIVIDKPAGLVVHPAAGHAQGTLVNALIAHCGDSLSGIGGVRRPGIVHRLDKDTSGLLVVAKTDTAHKALSEQFAAHGADGRLQRTYRALVWGALPRPRGHIDAPLGRSAANRTKMAVVPPAAGRHAVTHYEVVQVFSDDEGKAIASLVTLQLETGRTHQIRVHLAHIGHPVLGDPVYGVGFKTSAARLSDEARSALDALGRQALHAAELGFTHPKSGKQMHFISDLPADMAGLVTSLQGVPAAPAKAKANSPAKRRTKANGKAS
ncbi:MAG: RluA family pseudouridine synthase [Hyphomicrobiaceae bacterium]|nr:RluA family pseudouridine synthase [Hyphomicrobiaceae bacterium]